MLLVAADEATGGAQQLAPRRASLQPKPPPPLVVSAADAGSSNATAANATVIASTFGGGVAKAHEPFRRRPPPSGADASPRQAVGPYHFHPVLIAAHAATDEPLKSAGIFQSGTVAYETLIKLVSWPAGTPMSAVATARSVVRAAISNAATNHAAAVHDADDDDEERKEVVVVVSGSGQEADGSVSMVRPPVSPQSYQGVECSSDDAYGSLTSAPSRLVTADTTPMAVSSFPPRHVGGVPYAEMCDIGTDDLSDGTLPSPNRSAPGSTHVLVLGTPSNNGAPSPLLGVDDGAANVATDLVPGTDATGGVTAASEAAGAHARSHMGTEEHYYYYLPPTLHHRHEAAEAADPVMDGEPRVVLSSVEVVMKDNPLSCPDAGLLQPEAGTVVASRGGVTHHPTFLSEDANETVRQHRYRDTNDVYLDEHRQRRACVRIEMYEWLRVCHAFCDSLIAGGDPAGTTGHSKTSGVRVLRDSFVLSHCAALISMEVLDAEDVSRRYLQDEMLRDLGAVLHDADHRRRMVAGAAGLAPIRRVVLAYVFRRRVNRAARRMRMHRWAGTELRERQRIEAECWHEHTAAITVPALMAEEAYYRLAILRLYGAVGAAVASSWVWLYQRCSLFHVCFASHLNGAPRMSGRVCQHSLFHNLSVLEEWLRRQTEAAFDAFCVTVACQTRAAWLATTDEPAARHAVEHDEEERRFLVLCVLIQVTRSHQRRDCEYDEIAARRHVVDEWAETLPKLQSDVTH